MNASSPNMDLAMSITLLNTKLLKRIDQQLGIHGISFSEYMVMHHLQAAPNQTMRRIDLAECIGLTASGVTRLLALMEKIRLVKKQRNPRDARVSLVQLSKAGQQLFKDATVGFGHSADLFMQPLTANQATRLLELIQAVL